MELVDRLARVIVGYAVRTTSAAEADPARAQLPALWARARLPGAFGRVSSRADERLFAVLTDYESDRNGAWTQVVGVAVTSLDGLHEGLVAVQAPAARCLRLAARGAMPQALTQAWQEARSYTETGRAPVRAFTTDLEIHDDGGADLYLAVH
jgi:predicted transcriptional regulator YdeE